MKNFLVRLEAKSNLIVAIVMFLIMFVVLLVINGDIVGVGKLKQLSNGVGILDLELGYSVEKAYNLLDNLGIQGRDYYLKRIIPMDFILPLSYMLFYISSILYLLKLIPHKNESLIYIVLVPFMTFIFDYLENFAIIRILLCYPERLVLTAKVASFFTIFKLVCVFLSMFMIALLLVYNCVANKDQRNELGGRR